MVAGVVRICAGAHTATTGSVGIPLFGVLVLIVFAALLFAGRYPRGVFDFLLGINRWIFRLRSYASLMRDEYPPFRLDQGSREPQSASSDQL